VTTPFESLNIRGDQYLTSYKYDSLQDDENNSRSLFKRLGRVRHCLSALNICREVEQNKMTITDCC